MNNDVLNVDANNALSEDQQIELIIEEIRNALNKSTNEAQAIGAINDGVDGATFKSCRFNRSGSLTFCVQVDINDLTKDVLVKRRFH